jgi:hypothetical protein
MQGAFGSELRQETAADLSRDIEEPRNLVGRQRQTRHVTELLPKAEKQIVPTCHIPSIG